MRKQRYARHIYGKRDERFETGMFKANSAHGDGMEYGRVFGCMNLLSL
jgi:hypothetical protein